MTALLIVVFSIAGIYILFDFKHDLHMFQQNSYRIPRYWKYLRERDIASIWRMCDIAILFLFFSRLINEAGAALFLGIYCICKIILIQKRKFKKPLVFTKRVWRLYAVTALIFIGLYLWAIFKLGFEKETVAYYSGTILTFGILLLFSILSWVVLIIADIILMPVEKAINNSFIIDAKKILSQMPDLKVIGITGSYGKTSTKHYLFNILSEKYDVIMTPGSFNTPMGVVRTIREQMKPYYKIFICEMGAKQKGDIKEICDIVHPSIGIVTAVGPMHLDTFKTIENIRETKFELIDSLPKDGFAVVNKDFEQCANRKIINVDYMHYSTHSDSNSDEVVTARDIIYHSNGTDFKVTVGPDNREVEFHTNLVGDCNISNLLAAITVAYHLDLSDDEIKRGVAGISQVEHRLSVKKTPAGITIIDDAFNSNPYGSKMALEVLAAIKGGKKIVITPGMIELGDKQYIYNEELGEEIAKRNIDIAIIVGEHNREALIKGMLNGGKEKSSFYEAGNFNEAQTILSSIVKPGDVVLYENDLPDLFK